MFKSLPRTLPRTLAAAALSLAVALTGLSATATPARADNDELARVLAGVATLFIIGRAIDMHNDDRRNVTRNFPYLHVPPRHLRVAPEHCFRRFHTSDGRVRGYLARCMQNFVRVPGSLPPECLRRVMTDRGLRMLYGGRCLARNGWIREAELR